MSTEPVIKPQGEIPKDLITPLDPKLYAPNPEALAFLKATVTPDEDELRTRAEEVQKEAYVKYPYPCIRGFHHIALFMSDNTAYQRVLELGKSDPSAILLDIGCCMGTDVRKAAYDGYPGSQIVGCELVPEFLALGHKLYADAQTSPIRFIQGDVFTVKLPSPVQPVSPSSTPLPQVNSLDGLLGRVAAIYTGALFHLFDESTQHALALRLALLVRQGQPAIIFGRHQGLAEAGMIDDGYAKTRYGHSPESWVALWKQVFTAVRGEEFARDKVKIEVRLDQKGYGKSIEIAGQTHFGVLYWSIAISA
ncbi:unnamed protein product [Peniophora sp. CBMAI 1063]|nr:unnamed protein product [Peniophora sp. CBMAI 1063]